MAAALVAAGALQAATGFGFSLIASPALVGAYGGGTGITALTLASLVVNVLTLTTERRRLSGDWPVAARLVAWFLPGAVLGGLVLREAPAALLEVLIAVGVLGAILVRLLPAGGRVALPLAPTGVVAGAFGMATGVSGPPIVLHLLRAQMPPARTRDTLAAIFLATAVLAVGILLAVGEFGVPEALPVLLVATALGHLAGRRAFARLGVVAYERVSLATMAAGALASLLLLAT